jgi:hypothetical protein
LIGASIPAPSQLAEFKEDASAAQVLAITPKGHKILLKLE